LILTAGRWGCCSTEEARKLVTRMQGSLRIAFSVTVPWITTNGKLQLSTDRTTNGSNSSRRKVQVSQVKNWEQLRYLLKTKGIQNQESKEGVVNTSHDHVTSCKKEEGNCHDCFFLILP
jgi:hypothetical protein